MRTEGQTVFVPWYGKVLQGIVVREKDLMGMTAVRIPLQGQHPIALFTPGHIYDTEEAAGISESVPKVATSVPKISENVPKVSELSQLEAFKKANWDTERNHLRTDALDEFYFLWKMEHTPFGYVETTAEKPVPESGTKTCICADTKKQTDTIQLSLFD